MDRIFIITGTRKGIGKKLAEHFLAQGDVVCGCSRKPSSIEHENYRHFELDVGCEKDVVKMVRAVRREFGRIDVLLNNAGIASMNHILTTPVATAKRIMDTNFIGTFVFLREVAKVMMKKKTGTVVNFSTVAVPLDLEGEAAYAASKAAVVSLTRTASKELAGFNIRVNAVGPTPVKTDLIRFVPQDKLDGLLNRQAFRRFGEFEDVLNVIEFFISPESGFITGQVIYLGGVTD